MAYRLLSAVLGVLALSGWGMFAFHPRSSGEEQDLRAQVASIWNDRAQIIAERNQLRSLVDEQRQREAHQSQEGSKTGLDAAAITQPPAPQGSEPRISEADLATGSVSSPEEVAASVRTAQMALTQLGYGAIEADGVMGPRTRRAIEAFERANGLAVTGELGPVTVPALKRAAEAAIR